MYSCISADAVLAPTKDEKAAAAITARPSIFMVLTFISFSGGLTADIGIVWIVPYWRTRRRRGYAKAAE
jgi:hypothetical protein